MHIVLQRQRSVRKLFPPKRSLRAENERRSRGAKRVYETDRFPYTPTTEGATEVNRQRRTHLFGSSVHQDTEKIGFSACGVYRFDLVKDAAEVTCKRCLPTARKQIDNVDAAQVAPEKNI